MLRYVANQNKVPAFSSEIAACEASNCNTVTRFGVKANGVRLFS